jgi:hypothetical protein
MPAFSVWLNNVPHTNASHTIPVSEPGPVALPCHPPVWESHNDGHIRLRKYADVDEQRQQSAHDAMQIGEWMPG